MLQNYFKIAWRNIWRDKYYALINLIGFAVGFACCLLILLYVTDELTYDVFHKNAERIYRIEWYQPERGDVNNEIFVPEPLGRTLKEQFPEIEAVTVLLGGLEKRRFKKQQDSYEANAFELSPTGLFIFTLPLIQGEKATALDEPHEIIISETLARTFFPNENPIGKTLEEYAYWHTSPVSYKVGGVMRNMPLQSHFKADILTSSVQKDAEQEALDFTGFSSVAQYILLKKKVDATAFTQKINQFACKKGMDVKSRFVLRNIQDIHLHSHSERELGANGDTQYIYIFSSAAFFILLIACINYINLATARSLRRAKEVGIRKTMGANRGQLIRQFFAESLLVLIPALLLAIQLTEFALPIFNQWSNKALQLQTLPTGQLSLLALTLLVGILLLTTLYPACYLTRRKPVAALRGMLEHYPAEGLLRGGLVVVQFVISIFIILATLIVNQQMQYVSNKKLGFNKENVLLLNKVNYKNKATVFKQKLLQNPQIEKVSIANWSPGEMPGAASTMDDSIFKETVKTYFIWGDTALQQVLEIKVAEGRFFSKDHPEDFINYDSLLYDTKDFKEYQKRLAAQPIVLNQAAVKALKLKAPIGQNLSFSGVQGKVIGVVEDFHVQTLHHAIGPLCIKYAQPTTGETLIRFRPENLSATIQYVNHTWKELFPHEPFDYTFLDDNLAQLYLSEERLQQIFLFFSILGIGIACLGLLGLTAYAAERRQKEIGIRKVMGASVGNILALLSKDFLRLILIAAVIAFPIAWYFMNRWLQDFAYRIDIEWWIFALAGVAALSIALLTVSFQAIRAAVANPVESLRSE